MPEHQDLQQLQAVLRPNYATDVRFANVSLVQGAGNPGAMGDNLFNQGLKYGSVFRDLEMALPFFECSRLAFARALQGPRKKSASATIEDRLYGQFTASFGLFASSALLARCEEPENIASFEDAHSALVMSFREHILDDARKRPAGFETADFASYLLTFLALTAAGRFWHVASASVVDERILSLPIPKAFERLRRALVALVSSTADEAGALEQFRRAYAALVHPGAYRLGLLGNARFVEAYTWSLVKERGRLISAVVNLFEV